MKISFEPPGNLETWKLIAVVVSVCFCLCVGVETVATSSVKTEGKSVNSIRGDIVAGGDGVLNHTIRYSDGKVRVTVTTNSSTAVPIDELPAKSVVINGDETSGGAYYVDSSTSLTYKIPLEITRGKSDKLTRSGGSSWAIVHERALLSETELQVERSLSAPDGYRTPPLVVLGEYTVHQPAENLVFVQINKTEPRNSIPKIANTIKSADQEFRVSGGASNITAIIVPLPMAGGRVPVIGGINGNASLWVSEMARIDNPRSTWVHEFVHTQQNFTTEQEMEWFVEASATYFTNQIQFERGEYGKRLGFAALYAGNQYDEVVLAEPETWERNAEYHKGAYFLAQLDARIQNKTNERKSLRDVFEGLNEYKGTIDKKAFLTVIENETGLSGNWTARYIESSDIPDLSRQESEQALTEPESNTVQIGDLWSFCAEFLDTDSPSVR